MGGYKTITPLGTIFLLAVVIISGIVIGILYKTAFGAERARWSKPRKAKRLRWKQCHVSTPSSVITTTRTAPPRREVTLDGRSDDDLDIGALMTAIAVMPPASTAR